MFFVSFLNLTEGIFKYSYTVVFLLHYSYGVSNNFFVYFCCIVYILQYKGAHVKPGFAEHFYSNPARYKGRDNMFVSNKKKVGIFSVMLLHSST